MKNPLLVGGVLLTLSAPTLAQTAAQETEKPKEQTTPPIKTRPRSAVPP